MDAVLTAIKSRYDFVAKSLENELIFPPFGLTAFLTLAAPIFFAFTYIGQINDPLKYSKFSGPQQSDKTIIKVSGKIFLIIAYLPAFIFAFNTLIFYIYFHSDNPNINTSTNEYKHLIATNIMLILHFAKRLIESMFIHICSNKSALSLSLMIAGNYSFVVLLTLYYQLLNGKIDDYINCNKSFLIGIILFSIGQFGNFYHHYLLRINRLNDKSKSKNKQSKYVIPYGGFFKFIWMPHYFFEIISWIGMAVTSRHLTFYSSIIGMIGYLIGRAVTTKTWYKKKFADQCPDRKAIIPFVF